MNRNVSFACVVCLGALSALAFLLAMATYPGGGYNPAFRYSTKYWDEETGLYYYGRRFYSPELMRWKTRDPIEEEGGANLYAFCENNAVNGFDALGMKMKLIYSLKLL